MRILIATDAWHPQVNGVVRTYERLAEQLPALGVELSVLAPHDFRTLPCPTYPEIRLAVPGWRRVAARFERFKPEAVHIATEGPIGWMARRYCRGRGLPFTTSFHTRFPEYLAQRFAIPAAWTTAVLRGFHNAGHGLMVATPSLARELEREGFQRVMPWTRGVDTDLFRPRAVRRFGEGPVFLYVGRIAEEKSIAAFLDLDLPGHKVVVGGGPQLEELKARYPGVLFTGKKTGEDLAECYASADVFVFPSRTDTFGLVLLEAMASGLPVAAFPVTGPVDVVTPGTTGVLSDNLREAALAALALDRARVRARATEFGWEGAARLFLANITSACLKEPVRAQALRRLHLAKTSRRP